MPPPDAAPLDALSPAELRGLVGELIAEVDWLRAENRALRDEVARLKGLPPRPPRPSGMEEATGGGGAGGAGGRRSRRRRGAKRDRDAVTAEVVVKAAPPPGPRFKGHQDILVRDLRLSAEVVRYRRERWLAPSGETVLAPLPAGLVGGFGPGLRRFLLVAHAQGQVTTERLSALLAGIGLEISKRQVVRLLTSRLDDLIAEDQAVLQAGLAWPVIERLAAHPTRVFADEAAWTAHLAALGIDRLAVTPDAVQIATEGALWGTIQARGLLSDTVIVSDDAGQFRLGKHALCWIHAERLVHKLVPANDQQRRAIELTRELIWWFYADLKAWQREPCRRRAAALRARFDRIFTRRSGSVGLDRLLARQHRRKAELLRVLERPEIPLHTNGSENDIRACVTKRKISGGTMSEGGRTARDVLLGLMKTCRKLGVSFFRYLGDRLRVPGADPIPPLADLVRQASATA